MQPGNMAAPTMSSFSPNRPAAEAASGKSERTQRIVLAGLIAGYAGLYAVLCWQRFVSFHAQIDLSYYLRQAWGLGHGRFDLPLVQAPHIIGLHLEPVMLPLALLGRLGVPLVPLLLLGQAVAVALLAWPAWELGNRHLGERAAPWAAAAALLYPTVTVATLHDFHPVTLALAPLFSFIAALDQGRLRRALALGRAGLRTDDRGRRLQRGTRAFVSDERSHWRLRGPDS